MELIRKWCRNRGLPIEKTREFLRINNLSHWEQVTQLCSVQDLIDNFVDLWARNDPEGYAYAREQREAAKRRLEEAELRRKIAEEEGNGH